jgi:transcriptional regulator GlxA family with amidase domain
MLGNCQLIEGPTCQNPPALVPRNFARAYVEKRGCTPAKAVEAIRVDAARRRLEETEDRIESVAATAGFSSEEQMRCAFVRILGIPPREYRKRFATTAD